MATVTRRIARPAAACWRAFIDLDQLTAWVPNLRRVRIVTRQPDGLPAEVTFELASLSYSLVYRYDPVARRVDWAPRVGARDAVSGYATFAADGDACLMTYTLEEGPGRAADRRDDPEALMTAFADWMTRT